MIINGITGAMGHEIVKSCVKRNLPIAPFALRGASSSVVEISQQKVQLVTEQEFECLVAEQQQQGKALVVIDFTHPSRMNSNANLYNKLKLPFVMGTTGGDHESMVSAVEKSKNLAVIAPNMGKQVVAFQAMFEYMGENFPGSFAGYEVSVKESHQSTKADTSGTAKAVCASLSKLVNKEICEDSIEKCRTDEASKQFGVEEQHLLGHAHHTYRLTSPDGSVVFEFKHNVNGRSTYAEGVVDAVLFLVSRVQTTGKPKSKKKRVHVFDMVDVLNEMQ